MTRYTICFDEERDADILRWMDAQVNKSMSLKALVERSIAQEGYNDIFQLAWKQNIQNSTQLLNEPAPAVTGPVTQQPGRKRGRPRKNTSSAISSLIPETDTLKQKEGHKQLNPVPLAHSDIHQDKNTNLSLTNTPETAAASEPSAEQNRQCLSDKPSAVRESQPVKTAKENAGTENDGYQRPGNVNIDMTKFI